MISDRTSSSRPARARGKARKAKKAEALRARLVSQGKTDVCDAATFRARAAAAATGVQVENAIEVQQKLIRELDELPRLTWEERMGNSVSNWSLSDLERTASDISDAVRKEFAVCDAAGKCLLCCILNRFSFRRFARSGFCDSKFQDSVFVQLATHSDLAT